MAHVLNATLRLSQRTSTRKVSHVLSGSTRSLSSTSSPAARACAARNASFVAAFSSSRSSKAFSGVRAFSTKPEGAEERADAVTGIVNEVVEAQAQQSQESGDRPWQPRRGTREERLLAPSKTFFVSGLPFFATEEDVRKVFEDCGNVMHIRFGNPTRARQDPYAFVSMQTIAEATTIVESAKEEPFVLEGRPLAINWANLSRKYPPARFLYFDNFNNGDLGKLREFLGPLARAVDNAYFLRDRKREGSWLPAGMIQCRSVDEATEIIRACHGKPGPDGTPVHIRFARPPSNEGRGEQRHAGQEQEQSQAGEQEQ